MFTDIKGNKRYKINLHMHTTDSDGHKTPAEAAEIYRNKDYDAIAITDHWIVGEEREIDGMPIIAGCEYHFGIDPAEDYVYHIVSLFHEKDPMVELTDSPQTCVNKIIAAGGMPVLAHPAWSLNDPREAIKLEGIEFTEIFNTISGEGSSNRPYSGCFVDLCACKGKLYGLLAADDTHGYKRDCTVASIMVKADSLSREDIMKAIRDHDFYATTGPEVHVEVKDRIINIECTPAVKVDIFTNAAWSAGRHTVGENITHVSVPLSKIDKFARVEVTDENGRVAYSNLIKV